MTLCTNISSHSPVALVAPIVVTPVLMRNMSAP